MRILKTILLSAALCCCLQVQSIAVPIAAPQHQTVPAIPYAPVVTETIPATAAPGTSEIQQDKIRIEKIASPAAMFW